MTNRATARLLADVLTEAYGGASSLATRLIRFGKTSSTRQTPEPPLEQHQHNAASSQWDIALASWAPIMHFDAHALTVRASGSVRLGNHFDFDTAILLKVLLEQTKFTQV